MNADVNIRSNDGQTPLMVSANNSCIESCLMLMDYRADFNLRSKSGRNSLERGNAATREAIRSHISRAVYVQTPYL